MKERLRRLLASPSMVWIAALVAVVLFLPSIGGGFVLDDVLHQLLVRRVHPCFDRMLGDWDIFRVVDSKNGPLPRAVDVGFWPWWTHPEARFAFFRPLSSLTHALDYRLFPGWPALMHAESIAVFAAAVAVVTALYRRFSGATVAAGLSAVMYAADDAHTMDVAWIGNRNAVLAAAFGYGALLLHDRAARNGDHRARILSPLVLALALASGENALGALGYFAAYALWIEEGSWGKRAASLAPHAAVVVAWAVIYRLLGYGTAGSAHYVDPGRAPLSFLGVLLARLPVLLSGQLVGLPPADAWVVAPESAKPVLFAVFVASLLAVTAVLALGVRKRRENAFYATGLVLSLIPACATVPSDRLMLFAGFGAFGLVGDLLTAPRDHLRGASRALVRAGVGLLVFVHLVLPPPFLPLREVGTLDAMRGPTARADESLPADLTGKLLVAVSSPDCFVAPYAMAFRQVRGASVAEGVRNLAVVARGTLKVRRLAERTLELSPSEGFLHDPFSAIFRAEDRPFALGDRVELRGTTATVVEMMPDGKRPKTIAFTFDEPLEAPSLVWVAWTNARFERFVPPAVGAEAELPTASL